MVKAGKESFCCPATQIIKVASEPINYPMGVVRAANKIVKITRPYLRAQQTHLIGTFGFSYKQ